MTGREMLAVENIDAFYGDAQALWRVSLIVREHELMAVVGSNGAGKTTLLKAISGLVKPKHGTVTFLNSRIDNFRPNQIVGAGIVMVPEGRRLFSSMTVLENLELGAYTQNARKQKDATLEKVFEIFPILNERRNQMCGTLSGGEQQMAAIARGLMAVPKLLMLDEPSLGLAPIMVLRVFEAIKEIKDSGVTILLVEQNLSLALNSADRGCLLEHGNNILSGTAKELLEHEATKSLMAT